MSSTSATGTSPSLLRRVRNCADQAAWAEFVRRYGPLLYGWCCRWRLQESDAEDITQTVLVKLFCKMQTFSYDPTRSFRGYLKALTRYAWYALLRNRDHACVAGSGVRQALANVEARDDLQRLVDAQLEREVLEEAMERVRGRVEAHTWEAFRLTAQEGLSGAEAAGRLGIKVATVYQARSKVLKMLREEVARLEQPGSPPSVGRPKPGPTPE
jgi:RNA polymerase sigma-70 factor (ECF subfamily)